MNISNWIQGIVYTLLFALITGIPKESRCQQEERNTSIRSILVGGVVYMLYSENGEGGGNVAASVGKDGILLVDNMFKAATPKILQQLKRFNETAPVRVVINSHYHKDHIEGNSIFSKSAIIIAQANLYKRLLTSSKWAKTDALPNVTFADSMTLHFNGEEITLLHLPNGHTDNDVFVYFGSSKVLHMGDTYFNGMFPAIYEEGGGDVIQLIRNLEKIAEKLPEDVKIIPGHGALAKKSDLIYYIAMLKETTEIVSNGIKSGKTLQQMQTENVLEKYGKLGDGGAQTNQQYLAMLYRLLLNRNKGYKILLGWANNKKAY